MTIYELEGVALDAAAAKAAGYPLDSDGYRLDKRTNSGAPTPFHPSTDWRDGGPIIERERITIQRFHGDSEHVAAWSAYVDTEWGNGSDEIACNWKGRGEGQTALIAAMRAFVDSKMSEAIK